MALEAREELVDDLDDGTPAAETVSFGLDGINYTIDLTAENAARLRSDLANWIAAARRETPRHVRSTVTVDETRELASRVRTWARSRNIAVGHRGRLPADLVERYLRENATGSGAGTVSGAGAATPESADGHTA